MGAERSLTYCWTPDDTEESIVGADPHQDAIRSLRDGLGEVARAQGWPWHVGDQLTLIAWHPDGRLWKPIPDVMVHPHAGPELREEMDARSEGLPALIIEIASPSTYRSDVNVSAPTSRRREAKGYEYLAWPLPEYLVFDPMGALLPGQVRAWRSEEGRMREWRPEADGRYHSVLGVAFQPEGFFLRIYDPAGRPVPFNHEQSGLRARLERERGEAIRRAEQVEQERLEAIRRAEQAEQNNARLEQELAGLQAQLRHLRGQDSG